MRDVKLLISQRWDLIFRDKVSFHLMKISLAAGENDSKIVYKLSIIEVKQLKLSGLIVIGTN